MLTKQGQPEVPGTSPAQTPGFPAAPFNSNPVTRPTNPVARNLACLGPSLEIKGNVTGQEDLQIDGKVEGPISVEGRRLMVGRTAHLHSEVTAGEVVVYGKVTGNLRARDRVEIKKDGSVIGDIVTARISIEDGAYFKGKIEIDRPKSQPAPEHEKPERVGISLGS